MSAIVVNVRRAVDASLLLVQPLDGGFLLPLKRGGSKQTRQPRPSAVRLSIIDRRRASEKHPMPAVLGARRRRVPAPATEGEQGVRIVQAAPVVTDPSASPVTMSTRGARCTASRAGCRRAPRGRTSSPCRLLPGRCAPRSSFAHPFGPRRVAADACRVDVQPLPPGALLAVPGARRQRGREPGTGRQAVHESGARGTRALVRRGPAHPGGHVGSGKRQDQGQAEGDGVRREGSVSRPRLHRAAAQRADALPARALEPLDTDARRVHREGRPHADDSAQYAGRRGAGRSGSRRSMGITDLAWPFEASGFWGRTPPRPSTKLSNTSPSSNPAL